MTDPVRTGPAGGVCAGMNDLDWGGPIGLSYATDHPDNVARLIVMNSWAWPVNRDPYYIAFSSFMGGPIGRLLIRRRNVFATHAWGMKDIAFREKELKRWQQAFPGAQTIRLPGAGHFVQEEAPGELATAALGFLKTA